MGTSTSYSAPPSWGDLKSDLTRAANDGGAITPQVAANLLQSFISHNGGSQAIARGGGARGGGGGGGGGGRAHVARGGNARTIARGLGSFVADVGRVGLEQALRNAGWTDLVGRPVNEVLSALIDRLGGNSTTIDGVDARMALARLEQEYFAQAATPEELEQLLNAQVGNIEHLLQDYFGCYLYEVFCRVFFERLVQRVGDLRAHSVLDQIRTFVNATLANRVAGRDLSQIDWTGREGQQLTTDIMETTLNVFG